ncbi:MAG TPA: M28 family peptidase, partial [Gemmatimonadaceae bacterium]
MQMRLAAAALAATFVAIRPATAQAPAAHDSLAAINKAHLFATIAVLAADSMEGRKVGTPGGDRARAFLLKELTRIGVQPLVPGYTTQFTGRSYFNETSPVPYGEGRAKMPGHQVANYHIEGTNVLGVVRGTERPSRYIVVSAHYDHLGSARGRIWNGADDNASGSAGILAIAEWLVTHPPKNS